MSSTGEQISIFKESDQCKLCKIVYIDHILFRNINSEKVDPSIREAVGWITKQNEEAIWLLSDKPVDKQDNERTCVESGLVIFRSAILGVEQI